VKIFQGIFFQKLSSKQTNMVYVIFLAPFIKDIETYRYIFFQLLCEQSWQQYDQMMILSWNTTCIKIGPRRISKFKYFSKKKNIYNCFVCSFSNVSCNVSCHFQIQHRHFFGNIYMYIMVLIMDGYLPNICIFLCVVFLFGLLPITTKLQALKIGDITLNSCFEVW